MTFPTLQRSTVALAALLLSACSALPAVPAAQEAIPTPVQLTLGEAEAVAATYLEAWKRSDYAAMYSLISFRSRDHGARDGSPLLPWIRALLDERGLAAACDGEVVLRKSL